MQNRWREQKQKSLEYLQGLGLSKEDIITIIEEWIQDFVNFVENQIHTAQDGQKESEYKKWYPYNLLGSDVDRMIDRVIEKFVPNSDKITRAGNQYLETVNLISTMFIEYMNELKETHRVRVRIEGTNKTYSKVIRYRKHIEGLYSRWTPDIVYSVWDWLVPKEKEGSERARWLDESFFETVGRGVEVTSAIAGIDDTDVREIAEYLNSEEGREILDNMKVWQNGMKLRLTSSSGKEVYVYKKRNMAIVYDK